MSSSSPITVPPPSPVTSIRSRSRLGKSHSRRFHRRFPEVDPNEPLLDYYSCALLADILLQGQLYITENFFAFYSNIFGHKTQLLIPVRDVVEVTKECTARIIPNAVGIATEDEKYVFGSLLSRTSTYQLMQQIWLTSADPDISNIEDSESGNTSPLLPDGTDDDSIGLDRRLSTFIGPLPLLDLQSQPSVSRRLSHRDISKSVIGNIKRKSVSSRPAFRFSNHLSLFTAKDFWSKAEDAIFAMCRLPRTTLLLLFTTILLALLLLSATVLLYRITMVHQKVTLMEGRQQNQNSRLTNNLDIQTRREIMKKELLRINEDLKERIGLLIKVRQSFEQLFKVTSQMPNLCDPQVKDPRKEPSPKDIIH